LCPDYTQWSLQQHQEYTCQHNSNQLTEITLITTYAFLNQNSGAFLKKCKIASKASSAVWVSLYTKVLSVSVEKPTRAGDSRNNKFDYSFQLYWFLVKFYPSSKSFPTRYGPISCKYPIRLEHPGPPLNQIVRGALSEFFLAYTKT